MDAKLTLNIDQEIARKAKLYAKSKGRSLSDLVENYLKMISGNIKTGQAEFSPLVISLLGSISLPPDFDYKKAISDALIEKYLANE
jgi:hypothetical protein